MLRITLLSPAALLFLVLAGACDRADAPTAPVEAAFAKGGPKPDPVLPRAIFQIHEITGVPGQTGSFSGDGLAGDGQPAADSWSTYEDGLCDMIVYIARNQLDQTGTGDAIMKQGSRPSSSCAGRLAVIDLGNPGGNVASGLTGGGFVNIRCTAQTEDGGSCGYPNETDPNDPAVGHRNFAIDLPHDQCTLLRWDNGTPTGQPPQPPGLPTKVTYMGIHPDTGLRWWVAESLPPHHAGCFRTVKGKPQWDGVTRVIPFRIVILEKAI